MEVNVPGRLLIRELELVQLNVAVTFVAFSPPMLQTRAATGNLFGPTFTLLLSKPITFQVIGVTDNVVAALADWVGTRKEIAYNKIKLARKNKPTTLFINLPLLNTKSPDHAGV